MRVTREKHPRRHAHLAFNGLLSNRETALKEVGGEPDRQAFKKAHIYAILPLAKIQLFT